MKLAYFLPAAALAVAAYANSAQQFDFIVIGGGTAGLTIANRLSELKDINIAVVEAGSDERNNPNVTTIEGYGPGLGTQIDWNYESVSQPQAQGRKLAYSAGKALGGTSTINGMTYIRAEDVQIDAWEKIGNKGWNWENLFPYYKQSESFQTPTPAQVEAGASYSAKYHGTEGHVDVGYEFKLVNGTFPEVANATWQKEFGIPFNQDVNSGHVRGFSVWPKTLNRELSIREDASRAYYQPVENRPNLKVFKGLATKIIWADEDESDSMAIAQGVEFIASDSTPQAIYAQKEVIVSAGSLRSPAILELSGVGNPSILEKHSIPTKVSLSAVGENLQDQPNSSMMYKGKDIINGTAPYATFATAADFLDNPLKVAESTRAKLKEWAKLVAEANGNAVSAESLEYLFKIQHDLIFKQDVPFFEVLTTGSQETLVSAFWELLPFSRGSVHIGSSDPAQYPVINPNFFLVDWDLVPQAKLAQVVRKFWSSEPMSQLVESEITPGPEIPEDAGDEQWKQWVQGTFNSNSHPVGTLAMMPKEIGGVVDDKLMVYGTKNVRVVDASVFPFQVSGHLTSTLYALSERAADIIKASLGN